MKIVVLPGDGIGPEITGATCLVLEAVSKSFGIEIELLHDVVGHESLRRHGVTVTDELLQKVRTAEGLVLGPTATYEFRADKGEINPSMFFRKNLELFANVRPCRTIEESGSKVGSFDLVVMRENTEGFYADRNMAEGHGELLVTPDVAIAIRRITRFCTERIAHQAFKLARKRRKHVTIVHKANVLRISDGMFLDICRGIASQYPDVELVDEVLVDAMMALIVRDPARFDVIVTSNMYGDILSDLTAELSGSLGMGGSLNVGENHAMAQAIHGSAPDIAGAGVANPLSLFLSSALLLDWFAERSGDERYASAGQAVQAAVESAVREKQVTRDLGGRLGTIEAGKAVAERLGGRVLASAGAAS